MSNYIFGQGTPWTYDQLQQKRQIAQQLMANMGTPKNVGEGLNAIGDALLARGIEKRAAKEEERMRGEAQGMISGIMGGSADLNALMAAAGNPMIMDNPGYAMVVNSLIGDALKKPEPVDPRAERMRDIELAMAEAELQGIQNPPAPEPERVKAADGYTYYYAPGTELHGQRVFENVVAPERGPLVEINNAEDGKWGKPDPGFVWLTGPDGEVITEPDPSGRGFVPVQVPKRGGEADVEAKTAASQAEAEAIAAQGTVDLIDSILSDESLPDVTGRIGGRLDPEGFTGMFMPQSGIDLVSRIEQLQGQAFMQAFQSLKGGGQITELEGQAATNAIARLKRIQSPEAFRASLEELRTIADNGRRRAMGEDVPEYVPQGGSQNAGQPAAGGRVRYDAEGNRIP